MKFIFITQYIEKSKEIKLLVAMCLHGNSACIQWAGKSGEGIFHVMLPTSSSLMGSSVKL